MKEEGPHQPHFRKLEQPKEYLTPPFGSTGGPRHRRERKREESERTNAQLRERAQIRLKTELYTCAQRESMPIALPYKVNDGTARQKRKRAKERMEGQCPKEGRSRKKAQESKSRRREHAMQRSPSPSIAIGEWIKHHLEGEGKERERKGEAQGPKGRAKGVSKRSGDARARPSTKDHGRAGSLKPLRVRRAKE